MPVSATVVIGGESPPPDTGGGNNPDVTATVTGSGYYTFGHPFGVGDFTDVVATVGATYLQTDVMARHDDGSVRHAIFSGHTPGTINFNEGQSPVANLQPSIPDAEVAITISGTRYTASVATATEYRTWLDGPECTERHYKQALTNNIMARFYVRTYATNTRVDFVIENCGTFTSANGGAKTYSLDVSINSSVVYSDNSLTHYGHTRWRKTFWTASTPSAHVALNVQYVMDSKAVPNYDLPLVPSTSAINGLANTLTGTGYNGIRRDEPMGQGLYRRQWGETGADGVIAPYMQAAALYILSQSETAKNVTLACENVLGSFQIHYRDEDYGDYPIRLDNRPQITDEDFPRNSGAPYEVKMSHTPSTGYISYLFSGDHYYLEEMHFYAAQYTFINSGPGRDWEKGLVAFTQVRGQAWYLRNVADCAYITPDGYGAGSRPGGESYKDYWEQILEYNREYYFSRYVASPVDNNLGLVTNGLGLEYNSFTGFAPWQHSFFTWAIGHICELGYAWNDFLSFLAIYHDHVYDEWPCWARVSGYATQARDTSSSPVYSTLIELYNKNWSGACPSPTSNNGDYEYWPNAGVGRLWNHKAALSHVATQEHWDTFKAWSEPYSPGFDEQPQWSIAPRFESGGGGGTDLLPVANPSTNSATEAGSSVTGNVMTGDNLGDAPTTVTAADQGGTNIALGSVFSTTADAELTLESDGDYLYSPPPSGVPGNGLTEVFNYTITDNDGDSDSSTLSIAVTPQPTGGLPSWLPSVGSIASVPGGTGFASIVNAPGHAGPGNVFWPWCGGTLIRINSRPWIAIFGGGHADSSDNTIYGFGPLDSETPAWVRLAEPSDSSNRTGGSGYNADGRPNSPHSYYNLVGAGSKLVSTRQTFIWPNASSSNIGFMQDLAAYNGSPLSVNAANSALTLLPSAPSTGNYACAAYNSNDGLIYCYSGNNYFTLNPNTAQWSTIGTIGSVGYYNALAFDTNRNQFLHINNIYGGGQGIRLVNTSGNIIWSANGGVPNVSDMTLAFDPIRDRYVKLNGSGTRNISEFHPTNHTWSTRSFSGATPGGLITRGTYGRFLYVQELAAYFLVTQSVENNLSTVSVWAYKAS